MSNLESTDDSKPPVHRRLQPSEKQLKQSCSSSHYQRQKSFGSTSNQTIMAGLYDLEETLGKGHFATVKAAKHVFTGERVAVKVIDKTKLDSVSQKALLKEVLCMKLVQHPNVVKLYEVIDTSSKMYLVLELGQGDLYDLILKQQGGLPEPQARVYFRQILTAVSYCHKLHVAHRDLKPENVVFFPHQKKPDASSEPTSSHSTLGQVKLTDFGFSNKFCPGVNLDTSCGSLAYSAPEILLGDSYDAPLVDIWSLGVILYMLVCGRAPFQEANDSETLTMIMDVKYILPEHLSSCLKDLIRRMLVRDPGRRIRLHEIETHEWVRQDGEDEVQVDVEPLIVSNSLSENERERIFNEMVKGGVVGDVEEVRSSLKSNAYNHVTSTFYLLAERLLRDKARRPDKQTPPPTSPITTPSSPNPESSPPTSQPRIRRKNSHVLEDVVLPSAQSTTHHYHEKKPQTTQNIAGLDLETSSTSKFVCLPVVEPDEPSPRNSSPHHPHYYHHLGKRISNEQKNVEPKSGSPPKYCNTNRTRINKTHHSHSDSSDEGGFTSAPNNNQQQPVQQTTTILTTPSTPEEEAAETTTTETTTVFLKPSPSYEGIVDDETTSKRKKKRVLFLSWFFKRAGGGKITGNAAGTSSSKKTGANGIYKTRSCAELKSRGCKEVELNVRECFGVDGKPAG